MSSILCDNVIVVIKDDAVIGPRKVQISALFPPSRRSLSSTLANCAGG